MTPQRSVIEPLLDKRPDEVSCNVSDCFVDHGQDRHLVEGWLSQGDHADARGLPRASQSGWQLWAEPESGEFCAANYSGVELPQSYRLDGCIEAARHDGAVPKKDRVQTSVLIPPIEFVDYPEGTLRVGRAQQVGLLGQDECLSAWMERADFPGHLLLRRGLVPEHWELQPFDSVVAWRCSTVRRGKFEHQMIEGRAGVVNAVSDSGTDVGIRLANIDVDHVLPGLRVVLTSEDVRVECLPPLDGRIRHLKVLDCSLQLPLMAIGGAVFSGHGESGTGRAVHTEGTKDAGPRARCNAITAYIRAWPVHSP